MSNKAISVYAQAIQRQQEEQRTQNQVSPATPDADERRARHASPARPESTAIPASDARHAIHASRDLQFQDTLEAFITDILDKKSSQAAYFRCPPELNAALDHVLPHTEIQSGVRISKTRLFVFALAYILWDFHHNGPQSQLISFFKQS